MATDRVNRRPVVNTKRKQEQEEKSRVAEIKRANLRDAYVRLLKTPDGKKIVKDLFERSNVFDSAFTGNANTYFNEGRQAFGKELYKDIVALVRAGKLDATILLDFAPNISEKEINEIKRH